MKSVKHIAMYIGSLNKGGAERVLCNLAEYFYGEGYKVTMVTTYLADDEYDVPHGKWMAQTDSTIADSNNIAGSKGAFDGSEDKRDWIALNVLNPDDRLKRVFLKSADTAGIDRVFTALMPDERGGRISNFTRRIKKLRDTWKALKPDIILSFLGKNNCMAIQSSRGLDIPVVVSVRSNPSREYGSKGLGIAMNHLFPKAAGVVVQTTGAAAYFKESIRKKCKILPNSIHPDFIGREIFPFEARSNTVVSVGRLDDNKNQILLIRAFSRIMDKYPEYKLVLYGDGPARERYEKEAMELMRPKGFADKEGSRIRFAGNVSGVADKISDSEIFVLTSRQEGMPNALIEAMSLGLVCISTDCPCGGPVDLIRDGENGLLIPMGSDEEMTVALQSALEKCLQDKEFCKRLSEEAVKVRELYNPQRINEQWKKYFEGIMG